MDFLTKLLVSLINCNGDTEPTSLQQHQQSGMQDGIPSEEAEDEAPGPSRGALPKSQPAAGMLAQLKMHNQLRECWKNPLVLTPAGCASNPESPSTSPTSVSPSSSFDKPDNRERDVFAFCPDAPDMRREDERLKTFNEWPVTFLSPESLATNGFYYLGRGDEVRCAFCKVEIMKWIPGDDPANDHRRWAPQCPFLRRQAASGNVPREPAPAPAPAAPDPLDLFFDGMCQSTKRFPYPAQIKIKKTLFGAVIEAEEALVAEQQSYASLWARGACSSSSSEPADDDDRKPS